MLTGLSPDNVIGGNREVLVALVSGNDAEVRANLGPGSDGLVFTIQELSRGNLAFTYGNFLGSVGQPQLNADLLAGGSDRVAVTFAEAPPLLIDEGNRIWMWLTDTDGRQVLPGNNRPGTQVIIDGPGTYEFLLDDYLAHNSELNLASIARIGFTVVGPAGGSGEQGPYSWRLIDVRTATAVPEPSTLLLAEFAVIALFTHRRRRRA